MSASRTESALPVAASRSEAVRYGAYMLRRFGWFYHLLGLGRLLGRLRMEDHSVERVRSAAERGPIVYVLLERSALDHLALNTVLNKRRLPLSVWANGVTAFTWQPVVEAWADVGRRVRALWDRGLAPDPIASGWLARTVASGVPVVVCLEEGGRWIRKPAADPLPALLEAQAATDRPIQLLPVMVAWYMAPNHRAGGLRTFIRGARVTGLLSRVRALLFRGDEAFVQIGDPVDLQQLVARVDEARRPKALRTLLRRYLRRESRLIRGPELLPYNDLKRVVLDNPPMRALAAQEASASGRSVEQVRQEMERVYKRIAAHFRYGVVMMIRSLLRPLWTRVFAGVDVGERDIERIRAAMRDGSIVLVPSHKSHFDYVLLSWVFHSNDLIVPHIVTGENLAIWPMSVLMRSAGAFFIKRSFTGDRIFPAVFARYLRELLRLGYPVEFFIEGGRTRSGKLLPPRLGVLGMVLDAAAVRPTGHEVTLLPVSFAYEQVAEAGVYARELAGEKKKPENLAQVVRAGRVFGNRYGRAYVRVGEPVRASSLVDADAELPGWEDRSQADRKELLQTAGERILHRIGRATVVLPTSLVALAVLGHHRRGLKHSELLERCERMRALLRFCEAEEAASLELYSQAIAQALARLHRGKLLESFDGDGERVWAVPPDKRITLEFYKNQVLHYFAPAGYVALALRGRPDGPFTIEDLRGPFADLVWLLRREFILDPDRPATAQLHEAIGTLEVHGALSRVPDTEEPTWQVADPVRIGEIYSLFRNFVESYALVLRHVARFTASAATLRDLAAALQAERETWIATGEITRPEALSMETLDNALRAFEEDGVLIRDDRGVVVDVEQQQTRLQTLEPLLP